jgi:hypothetical protein
LRIERVGRTPRHHQQQQGYLHPMGYFECSHDNAQFYQEGEFFADDIETQMILSPFGRNPIIGSVAPARAEQS